MTVDDAVKLMDAGAKLCGAVIWPVLVLAILVRFSRELRDFAANLSELTLKGGGFEASAKRQQAQAVAALAAAAVTHHEAVTDPAFVAKEARAAADVVAEVATPRAMRRAAGSTVLWVDDRPNNNVHERQALEAMGVRFELALSTDEALEKLKQRPMDAVISDMGRPSDPRAGYTLLEKLRTSGNQLPYIIYAGSNAPEHRAEARQKGALGSTNRPDELFEMVLRVLGRAT